MESTQPPDQLDAVDGDDLPARERLPQHRGRPGVVPVVEAGHQHDLVADVEIRVARGQPLAVAHDLGGHGQR